MPYRRVSLVSCLLAVAALALGPGIRASSSGINGFSGNPATTSGLTCNVCHSGGIVPTVALEGPATVQVGTIATYTLRISGGQEIGGGFDVSATGGTLSTVESGTQILFDEATHTAPRDVDGSGEVVFSFGWTAPATPGTVTLYGSGNSVNLQAGTNGDASASDVLTVQVVDGPTAGPGETAGAGLAPLLVTARDTLTGSMSLTYGPACESTGHILYWGPLDQVATTSYAGESCAVGTSGAVSGFDPGPGSVYFLIVGTKGTTEGSYGTQRLPGGATPERPPFTLNACGTVQQLADRCD